MVVVKFLMAVLLMFNGGIARVENLTDSFKDANSIIVSVENIKTELKKGDEKYELVLNALYEITEYSHEMPAFGVSIDNYTREDMKTGTYIELEFGTLLSHEGMDYEALLIKVEKESFGFNLIRRVNGKYDGRCFYISLDSSMAKLAEAVDEVTQK